jgi:hypothetical protein
MSSGRILWRGRELPALSPGVEFKEEGHEYRVLGAKWPSVTGFLSDYYDGPDDSAAAASGTSAHDHAFHFVKGTIAFDRVEEQMKPTLIGIKDGLKELGVDVYGEDSVLAEYIVHSRKFHFIGRLDFLFAVKLNDLLVDLKTGSPSEKATRRTGLQIGGYAIAAIELGITTTAKLRGAELNVQPDGKWRVREFKMREVMQTFLAQVQVKNYFSKV